MSALEARLAAVNDILATTPDAEPYFYGTTIAEGVSLEVGGFVLFLTPCMGERVDDMSIGIYTVAEFVGALEPEDLIDLTPAEVPETWAYLVAMASADDADTASQQDAPIVWPGDPACRYESS